LSIYHSRFLDMGERYGHMDMGVSSSRSSLADSPSITITSWPMEWNGMVNCFLLSNFMANICRLWPRSRVGDPAEMHLGSGVSRQPQPRLQLKSYNFIFIFICSRLAFASSAGFTFLYNLIRMCFSGNCIIFFYYQMQPSSVWLETGVHVIWPGAGPWSCW